MRPAGSRPRPGRDGRQPDAPVSLQKSRTQRHYGTSDDATGALSFGLSSALILAEPVLGAHPERHVFPPGVRVVGHVPVAARGAEVAAGHREPLGAIEFLLADDRPLGADITVGRAIVLRA